jgi:nucleoside-diphosphate-sugar epimerase
MTTLVTGATGFTGINIVRILAEAGETVIALGHRPASPECHQFLRGLDDKVQFVVGDVLDTAGMLSLAEGNGVQRFVHGAAITPSGDVERSIPQHIVNVNLMGTVSMLEVAKKVSADRFVFTSSSGIYGAPQDRTGLVREDSPLQLNSFYTICKHACELLLKRYKNLFGLSTVAGRMTAIYGPMERVTASRGQPSTIYEVVSALLARRAVKARGREFVRDYTHVEDASSIWRHLTLASDLGHDVYNVSAGVAYSLGEVLETLHELDPTFSYSYAAPDQDADVEITPEGERGALDITRVSTEFGFSPRYDLKRGMESYLEWAREYLALFSSDQY